MSERRGLVAFLAVLVLVASTATSLVVAEVRRGIEVHLDEGQPVYELVSDGPGLTVEPAAPDHSPGNGTTTAPALASNATASSSAQPTPAPQPSPSPTKAPTPTPSPSPSPSPPPRHRTRSS